MRNTFDYRDLRLFEPFPGELPVDLVGAGDPATVRVAKLDGAAIGAYRLRRAADARFVLAALGVHPPYRGRGAGRWLLGHALGVAESKGGRSVLAWAADCPKARRFLQRAGFVAAKQGEVGAERSALVFHMTPE